MGDICTLDNEGWLTVVGRTSDFIIRGGKNISAAQVEDEVATHPAVALAAAVAQPDPVFGERVCVYAELKPGNTLELEELLAHLDARGTSPRSLARVPRRAGSPPALQRRQGRQGRSPGRRASTRRLPTAADRRRTRPMKNIEDLSSDLEFTKAKTGDERTVTFLPEPERADRRYTVISVDDHIVEPPHMFEGAFPPKFADRAPRVVENEDGARDVALRRRRAPERRVQRRRRAARRRVQLRADPLRRDATRRVGHRRPRRRHGPQRRVRVAELPVVPARLRRPALPARDAGSRPRARVRSARGTTGTSRSGRARTPTASSRARSRGCSIPRSRPTRSARTPRAGSRR